MIKIANNLQTLVKASNEGDSNIMRDLGLLGLGGAGIGGLTLAANKHRKHWMKNPDGSYTRRMSTLADRDNPRPMRITPGRAMLPPSSQVNLEAYRRALVDESLERMRVRIREQWKDNLKPIDHPNFIAWEKDKANHAKAVARAHSIIDHPAQRIRIDEAALRDAPPTPGQQRIRIDEAALRGPKPPTSVFTDPDLFSNIFKRIIRRR